MLEVERESYTITFVCYKICVKTECEACDLFTGKVQLR